ncbi:hypothetical protein ABBQ38_004750 [Trebouxia sp. C0009 RCD-2024]
MPGLLQSPEGNFGSAKVIYALVAEFLGTMLFTFAGTTTPASGISNWAPWGNGMSLAVMVFITANISGGHLNPAVTLATMFTGHMKFTRGLAYMFLQLCGACFGILMAAGLVPGASVGMGNSGTGCFTTGQNVTLGMLFGWETVMTFVLVSVVYAVAIGEPSFGIMGPFAVGLALFAMVFAGSQYTGTAINPARALGPAIVFHCHWNKVWLYVIAEFVGGVAAGLMAGPLYGTHAPWLAKILPWVKPTEHGDGDDNGLENQTSNVGETEMQAPLYAAKQSKGTKLTADGASTMV